MTTANKDVKTQDGAGTSAAGKSMATGAKKAATPAKEAAANGARKKRSPPGGMPKAGKDPKGGLTAAGRKYFEEKEGLHLRPGVRGAADTPEKMVRKGSFLRRHYANPRGPVVDPKGHPTRQALQAAAWGEPVPKNEADERRLAAKGSELLEKYHEAKGDKPKNKVVPKRPKATGR